MASTESLTEFLRNRRREEQQRQVDWAAERDDWLEDLRELGKLIDDWLQEAVQENLVEVQHGETELQEEALGRYRAPGWEIRAGSKVVSVVPVGRVIIGGKGRVDMRCGPQKRMLIRSDKGSWRLHERDQRGGIDSGQALTRETFSRAVRDLLS